MPAGSDPAARPGGFAEVDWSRWEPTERAVLCFVRDGDRLLLIHKKTGLGAGKVNAPGGRIDPGEAAEEAAVREVREEVGVELADIRYIASQPWPFPHQVMVGFMARYAGGEIVIDTHELAGAAWFTRDTLPDIPRPGTVARELIDAWLRETLAPARLA